MKKKKIINGIIFYRHLNGDGLVAETATVAKTVYVGSKAMVCDNATKAPVIDAVFPLAEAAVAHRRMETGEHIGKIVLRV